MTGDPRGADGAVSASRRVYEGLLAAYPRRFREQYGEEMADLFENVCREQVRRGGWGRLLLAWAEAAADLVAGSAAERRRLLMDTTGWSVTRWGGLSAVAGGALVALCGLLFPWFLSAPAGWSASRVGAAPVGVLIGASLAGVLLLSGGVLGMVALIAERGSAGARRPPRPRGRRAGSLGWARGSAVAGLVLAVAAAASSSALLAAYLLPGGLAAGGPNGAAAGPLRAAVIAAALLSSLGLPAASALLGAAAWRSGALGRWRALPAAVGALTLLAPVAGTAAAHAAWDVLPPGGATAMFVMVGAPQVAIGVAWAALGFVLSRRGAGGPGPRRTVAGA